MLLTFKEPVKNVHGKRKQFGETAQKMVAFISCPSRVIHDFGKVEKFKCIPAFRDPYGISSSELKEWAGYRRSFCGLNWAKFTS